MYQQDFDAAQDVHGPGESGAQVETYTNGPAKLRPQ